MTVFFKRTYSANKHNTTHKERKQPHGEYRKTSRNLHALSDDVCYDLIFLDIELQNELNGVQVGNVIRDDYNDERTQIVYISWNRKYQYQLAWARTMIS